MVKSKINPEKVHYKELKEIDNEDIGYASSIYELELYDNLVEIALGKEKYTYSNYDIIYYPIYLILGNMPKAKIGVFEIESNNLINILDEENDIDLHKGNLLFFDNEKYIRDLILKYRELNTDIDEIDSDIEDIEKHTDNLINKNDKEVDIEAEDLDDEDAVIRLNIPADMKSKELEKVNETLKQGVFIVDTEVKLPLMLMEETPAESETIKSQYTDNPKNIWIEKFMKNTNYNIIDNEGGGDCFFAVVRDAYEQIGHKTTINKLRALLAKEANDDLYQGYRVMYMNFLAELQSKEKDMKDIKKISTELKKRNERSSNKEETTKLLNEAKLLINKYNSLKTEKEDIKEMMDEFKFMKDIDTLDKFKEYIQTSNYWADTWAISTLEKLLNVKIIILSQETYNNGDLDSVLQCGQLNDDVLERQGNFSPDYYIMACYLGNHYTLVTYKDKRIFKFTEIPYDIKVMVINKCMEKNAGPYYLIKDFRNFKTKLGLSPDEGYPEEDENVDYELYDPETVFMFHSKSSHQKAGKGSGEKINPARLTEFNTLNKDKVCEDWRKKLDDSWISPFTLDRHRWASVEHYFQGSQYKKGFPDFYLKFSLDSDSDISKDVSLAKLAGSKSNKKGKLKQKLRSDNIIIDADFYEIGLNPRHVEERNNALTAKFTQNLDLKKVLMETKDAKLMHFERSSPAVADELLMKLRKKIRDDDKLNK